MKRGSPGNNYNKLFIFLLITAFFGPYYPGTPLRLDQIVGWIYIVALLFSLLVNVRMPLPPSPDRYMIFFSFLIVFIATLRLFVGVENYRSAFQFANQYSYFFAGTAIFYLHRDRFVSSKTFLIGTLFFISIFLNLFAFFQFINPNHDLVSAGLRWYGGVGDEGYAFGDFNTNGALTLLGGGQSISIFSGMQGLAIFNLFIIAAAYGSLNDSLFKGWVKYLSPFVILLALLGGILSGSKTFLLGIIIFFIVIGICGTFTSKQKGYAFFFFFVFIGIFYYFSSLSRVTGDVWNLIMDVRIWDILRSRFSSADSEGYLSDVMAKTFEPFTLIFGQGSFAGDYKYTDFEFRQVVLVGGIPLFFLYYGFLIYLLALNWWSKKSSCYGLPLFALGLTYLISGVGMDTHLQARTMPLWIIVNLLVGITRRTQPTGSLQEVPKV